ncbi:hypothetical protein [Ktedonospora formicarum]|uniref:hypothetical protein n=1 Tax=Ktedonospora formicarum TaxID=2778364 RepID=UPI001C68DC9E|nr:hypothetical protein [Ktedonospora formicarum]
MSCCIVVRAARSNEMWQADHCLLPILVKDGQGKSGRPWLTVIEDAREPGDCRVSFQLVSWKSPSRRR